ncbi:MAG: GNAT family N-acetyltransferase [Marinilabiliaceae bacterium]|nr:GNAT family N-acetyltransferase [Marinilabiliaceae bacterium]
MKEQIDLSEFYRLTKADADIFAQCCANAYHQYPLMNWMVGERISEKENLCLWRTNFLSTYNNAITIAESAQLYSIAHWLPPYSKGIRPLKYIINGGWRLSHFWSRMLSYEDYANAIRKRLTGGECWYLSNLAVRFSRRGEGLAGKLIRPVLRKCDEIGVPAFLETHTEQTVDMYEHFGFKIAEIGTVPDSKLSHWAMIYEPQSQQ